MGVRKMGITVTAGMNAPELVNQYYINEHSDCIKQKLCSLSLPRWQWDDS